MDARRATRGGAASADGGVLGTPAGGGSGLGAWLVRWRLALRIARRDARRHKARTALIVTMLMLPALAGAFALTAMASSSPTTATIVANELGTAGQAKVFDARMEPSCELVQTSDAQESGCANADGSAMPTMADAETQDGLLAGSQGPSGAEVAAIAGTKDRYVQLASEQATLVAGERAYPWAWVLQGDIAALPGLAIPAVGRQPAGPNEAFLAAETAQILGASVGSELTLRIADGQQASTRVVGIGAIRRNMSPMDVVLGVGTFPVDPAVWEVSTYLIGDEPIDWAAVRRLNAAGYVALSRSVALDPPSNAAGLISRSPDVPSVQAVTLTLGIGAIGLIEVLLIVGPAFAVGAKRQRRTLALLAAAGGVPADLGRVVRATGLAFGAVGGLLGAGLGVGAAGIVVSRGSWAGYPFPNFVVPWWWVAPLVPVTALLGTGAAWLAGRSAARMSPAEALREGPRAGSGRRSHAWPGLAVAALGLAGAIVGGVIGQGPVAMAGAVLVLLGVAALAGPIVSLVARLAPRVGVATRLALRDADRHRARTASALAAVIACVAGGTLAMGFAASADRAQRSMQYPLAADGLITVARNSKAPGDGQAALAASLASIREIAPMAAVSPVSVLADGKEALADVGIVCPGEASGDAGNQSVTADGGAPRGGCAATLGAYPAGPWQDSRGMGQAGIIEDDGTVIGGNGLPGATEAAQALRSGQVLTNVPSAIGPDGTITVSLTARPSAEQAPSQERSYALPARLVAWQASDYNLVVPPTVARSLGLTDYLSGYLLVPERPLTRDQVARLDALSDEWSAGPQVAVTASPQPVTPLELLLFAAIGLVIAASATWIAVGLAAADSRPDLVSLAAVGASPGVRRRFAGAQAGVIALIGAVVGACVGTVALWVAVLLQRSDPLEQGAQWSAMVPVVPEVALVVGVPLVAVLGAMAVTRSRMPNLGRRLA